MKKNREALFVFYESFFAGTLDVSDSGTLSFQYDSFWLEKKDSFPLSHTLPLQKEQFSPERSHAFFANLLPEGDFRKQMAAKLGISESSDYQFLKKIGGECAGALQIFENKNQVEEQSRNSAKDRLLDENKLKKILLQKSVFPAYDGGLHSIRLSLAGAQHKLPVIYYEDESLLYSASEFHASTHILKIPNKNYRYLPENECFMNWTARAFGLNVPDAFLYKITPRNKEHLLLVKRYDRFVEDGIVKRIHQEDFCQALGIFPDSKYEKEGGVSFFDAVNLIREISVEPALDTDQLLDWVIFNLVCRNSDAHGKNISILYLEKGARLAPFYDLVCTGMYDNLDRNLAMSIGSKQDPGNISRKDWQVFAESIDIGFPFLMKKVIEKIKRIETAKEESFALFSEKYGRIEFINQLRLKIQRQAKRIAELTL